MVHTSVRVSKEKSTKASERGWNWCGGWGRIVMDQGARG